MAYSCISSMASGASLSPFLAWRRPPTVDMATLLSSPDHLFVRSTVGFAARDRDIRAMAVVKKYKGTRMKEKRLAQLIEQKILEAKKACEGDEASSDGCKVAWDEVEEVSKAKATLRRRMEESGRDPLEPFCMENPETDECSVVDDD